MQQLKILILTSLAAVILGSAAVSAQTANGALKGMENPGLQIETLDNDSAACNITKARLVRAVKDGTVDTPFEFNGYNYNLYIRISSLFRAGECFSSVDVAAYYQGRLPMPAYPGGAYSKVVLWERGTVLVSRRELHGREVSIIVENLMRSLVIDWKRDNS
jgi:hypothetical protein